MYSQTIKYTHYVKNSENYLRDPRDRDCWFGFFYDYTYCRTLDGVSVVMLCGHVLASNKQKLIVSVISSLKFADLSKCLSPKGDFYVTNIIINKKSADFFSASNVSSLTVNSDEILVVGKVND